MLSLGLVVASPRGARAEDGHDAKAAQALFEDAMALMMAKRYPEACVKFEASQRLDPGMGTQFRLGECYENIGRIGSAYRLYTEVAEAAKRERLPDREQAARKKAEALRPRLPRLAIRVAPIVASLDGLKVLRDGAPVEPSAWGVSAPVDPGEHTMEAIAQGKTPWRQKIKIAEGEALEVIVPALSDEASPSPPREGEKARALSPAPDTASLVASPPSHASAGTVSGPRAAALFAGLLGASGVAAGAALGLSARATWQDAKRQCGGDVERCSATGIELGEGAKSASTASTVSFILGGAGFIAAVSLWLLSPGRAAPPSRRGALSVLPEIGPGGAAGVATVRF